MRRKTGSLLPLETAICEVASLLKQRGVTQFHGFSIAKELKHAGDTKLLTAYGTLYRALDRLEQMGFLRSEMEDPHIASAEGRPGRRLYELTADGHQAVVEVTKSEPKARAKRKRGWSAV
jgi:PadR family transcriptional regulator, regulatory protein PadR